MAITIGIVSFKSKRGNILVWVPLTWFCFVVVFSKCLAADATSDSSPKSETAAGIPEIVRWQRLQQLSAEAEEASKVARELQRTVDSIKLTLTPSNQIVFPAGEFQTALENLKGALTNLLAWTTNSQKTVALRESGLTEPFESAYYTVSRLLSTAEQKYYDLANLVDYQSQTEADRIARRISQRIRNYRISRESISLRKCENLARKINEISTQQNAGNLIIEAFREVSILDVTSVQSEWEKVAAESKRYAEEFRDGLLQELQSLTTRISDIRIAQADLDKAYVGQVSKKKEFEAQSFTAVYVMLTILLVVFVSLGFFPKELSAQLVEQRTLIEVVSMAFLLLVILILGNGELLKTEALGTLLGTIAGYIFGRKSTENSTKRNSVEDPTSIPHSPSIAVEPIGGGQIKICPRVSEGAIAYEFWMTRNNKFQFIGSQTNPEMIVPGLNPGEKIQAQVRCVVASGVSHFSAPVECVVT